MKYLSTFLLLFTGFFLASSSTVYAGSCSLSANVTQYNDNFNIGVAANIDFEDSNSYKVAISYNGTHSYTDATSETELRTVIQNLSVSTWGGRDIQITVLPSICEIGSDRSECQESCSESLTLDADTAPELDPGTQRDEIIPDTPTDSGGITNIYICEQTGEKGTELRDACELCMGEDNYGEGNVWTAFGCIGTSPESLTQGIMSVLLGLGGGAALLMILMGAFTITTATGNPERLKQGQQIITSAIIGLVFIIFSVILLQVIGIQILAIPGFG